MHFYIVFMRGHQDSHGNKQRFCIWLLKEQQPQSIDSLWWNVYRTSWQNKAHQKNNWSPLLIQVICTLHFTLQGTYGIPSYPILSSIGVVSRGEPFGNLLLATVSPVRQCAGSAAVRNVTLCEVSPPLCIFSLICWSGASWRRAELVIWLQQILMWH